MCIYFSGFRYPAEFRLLFPVLKLPILLQFRKCYLLLARRNGRGKISFGRQYPFSVTIFVSTLLFTSISHTMNISITLSSAIPVSHTRPCFRIIFHSIDTYHSVSYPSSMFNIIPFPNPRPPYSVSSYLNIFFPSQYLST
jgi:hypothetical protein